MGRAHEGLPIGLVEDISMTLGKHPVGMPSPCWTTHLAGPAPPKKGGEGWEYTPMKQSEGVGQWN
jgi:hypothetical protein